MKSTSGCRLHRPRRSLRELIVATALCAFMAATAAWAVPYASNIRVTGTTVTFTLNEPADLLVYRVNGGSFRSLDGSTKGSKSFSLDAPGDDFTIIARKNAGVGYNQPDSSIIPASATGLSQPSAGAGFNLISEDSNPLNRFNSPRGVSVSRFPGALNFGVAYIANSAAGTTTTIVRSVGDGLYALNADQSDAFGYRDTAQDPGGFFDALGNSANSPFKVFAAANGEVYTADFSDANSCVYRARADLTAPGDGVQVLAVIGGPPTLPPNQTHGSAMAVYVEGSLAGQDLVLYVTDEDLRSPAAADDRSSLWRYPINGGPLPSAVAPTRVNQSIVTVPLAVTDVNRGRDGKWYLSQNRIVGNEAGVIVLDEDGVLIFDSLSASRALLAEPTAPDILRNVQGSAVSDDQQWMALIINNSDVAVLPLIAGIPDINGRLVVDTGVDVNSGRDIAFDAAGNIHYVSSGQALYRVIAPAGETWASTTRRNGVYSFAVRNVPDLIIARDGEQIRVEWTGGILQESASVLGPWVDSTDINGALRASPYAFYSTGDARLFRLRRS